RGRGPAAQLYRSSRARMRETGAWTAATDRPYCPPPGTRCSPIPSTRDMLTTELLARVPLFQQLDQADLERIAAATRSESYEPGKEIVRIGDAGHALYVVLEGTVLVVYPARSSDVELARLGVGEFFGEMAILNEKPRSATVRTIDAVR